MRSRQLTTSNIAFPQNFIVIVNVHLCNGTFNQTKVQNLESLLVLPSATTSIAISRTLTYASEILWLLIYILDINQRQIFR